MSATPLDVEHGGKMYSGEFTVERGVLTVTTERGRKAVQLGHMAPERLARIVFRELINAGKA